MEPIKVKELPIEYPIDKDLLKLVSEANYKYGEYKSCLKNVDFDSKFFLDSIILNESFKSTQIEGTQISQDDVYYLKYMPQTDENLEIQNLKQVIDYSKEYLENNNETVLLGSTGTANALVWDKTKGIYTFTNPNDFLDNDLTKKIKIGDDEFTLSSDLVEIKVNSKEDS